MGFLALVVYIWQLAEKLAKAYLDNMT